VCVSVVQYPSPNTVFSIADFKHPSLFLFVSNFVNGDI
jgi:hypothetical protein